MTMIKITKRYNSRKLALQALYAWTFTGNDLNRIEAYFLTNPDIIKTLKNTDISHFKALFHGIPAKIDELDEMLLPHIDRPIGDIDVIELLLLRMGVYELYENHIPKKVVINEMVELAKRFGGEDGYKYLNGILDKLNYE